MTTKEAKCRIIVASRARSIPWALTLLLTAIVAFPGCTPSKEYNRGVMLMKKKKYEKAVEAFEKAIRKDPKLGEAHYNLGACKYYLARQAAEKGDRAAALRLVKESMTAKNRAWEIFKQGRFKVVKDKSQRQQILDGLENLDKQWRKHGQSDEMLMDYLTGKRQPEPPSEPAPRPPRDPASPASSPSPSTRPTGSPAAQARPSTQASPSAQARPSAAPSRASDAARPPSTGRPAGR